MKDRASLHAVSLGRACALVVVALWGCSERRPAPISPCTTTEVARRTSLEFVETVDLLFMIDNSGSMAQEQSLLRAEIPRMIHALSEGDRDLDGVRDFPPLRSLHVGIIHSDLGAGDVPEGEVVPSCDPGLGDDGIMRSSSRGFGGCMTSYPRRVFELNVGVDDPATFVAEVGCIAGVTTGGCGFEQQLEATLKALSPASPQPFVASFYVPPTFYGGARGHGDGANAGFLRADSVLAIVLVTDEEDCSVPAYDIFYPGSPLYTGNPLNLRCERFDEDRYPVERYVAGFRQLREDPSMLVYSAIVGIPEDLAGHRYEAMLADRRTQVVEDPAMEPAQRHLPSCDTANGIAFAPRRMIEVARGLRDLGVHTTIQSICASSFTDGVDAIVHEIAQAIDAECLPRALPQAPDGTVACHLEELLSEGSECEALGLERVGWENVERIDGSLIPRPLCRLPQVTPLEGLEGSEGPGWWYDSESEDVLRTCARNATPQRIVYLNHTPPIGAEVRFRCVQAIVPQNGPIQLGTFCTPFAPSGPENVCSSGALTCDLLTRGCGLACANDTDCERGGLAGFVCDDRSLLESVGGDPRRVPDWNGDGVVDREDTVRSDGSLTTHGYCVQPTCP